MDKDKYNIRTAGPIIGQCIGDNQHVSMSFSNEQTPHNNASTPEQKREIIERLYQLWSKNPEMRFGRMVSVPSLYYVSDFKLIEDLEWLYEQRREGGR
jgi:hypothetical protein